MKYPWGCDALGSQVECIRGINGRNLLYWFVIQILFLFATIYVSVSMTVVYRYVCDIERKALKYSFLATLQGQNRKKTMKRSRRVMIQGALYSLAMVLIYVFGFIHTIVAITAQKHIEVLLLITFTLTPLQGVFNIAIYLIPVFRDRLKIYRQSKKSNEKEQETKIKVHRRLSTEAYYKRPRSSIIVMGEEDKREIPVLHRHTFYPDSNTAEESGRADNIHDGHDDHAAIDDDESDTEAYYKKTRSSVIVEEKEEKKDIPVIQQHTFYPESDMAEGSGEGDNIYDDHAAIDDDESGRDSSGEEFY